ncbi:MAG: hypothetical protein NVS4B8_16150 [Herpetosiphon sp.]
MTFDACETPTRRAGFDQRILSILRQTRAPATLFLCGHWISSHPNETRELAADSLLELGNHSWGHPDFRQLKAGTMDLEISTTQKLMYQVTGRQGTLFRLPYGFGNTLALETISRHGLKTIQWDVVTGDPDPNIDANHIVQTVTRQARNGSIIIMHINGRGWHTAEALPRLITAIRSRGLTLTTVSDVLGSKTS